MDGNLAFRKFGEVIQGIYEFMLNVKLPVFGLDISLWHIFLYGAIGALVVWFMHKYFG